MPEKPLAEYVNASSREAAEGISVESKLPTEVGPVASLLKSTCTLAALGCLNDHSEKRAGMASHLEPQSSRLHASLITSDMGKAQVKNEALGCMFSVFVISGRGWCLFHS